jgi:hypothetical protein
MTKKLVPMQENDEFLAQLNQATGFMGGMPVPPLMKFDADKGQWMIETDERDKNEKPVYKAVGESINMHIITTRKMVQSNFGNDKHYYSREFQNNYLELYNENRELVWKGVYAELKNQAIYKDLKFVQVLYVFAGKENEPKLYRIKLTGSKLINLFPYLNGFKNDNPARYMTISGKGAKKQNGGVTYFELMFKRGDLVDQKLVIERVNQVNQYLGAYAQARANCQQPAGYLKTEPPIQNEQLPPPAEEPPIPSDDDIALEPVDF